ncbi:MAG TPA: hypothetical protein VGN06_05025 [Gaiellaceae bacterium]
MKRPRLPIGKVVVITIGLAIALGLRPISVREILAAYVLALTAITLAELTRMARIEEEWERSSSELERALAPRKSVRVRPAELVRVERDLTLSAASAGEFHTRLRPLLLEIAAARVRNPREALDADTWELLRPDRAAPDDRTAPGLPLRRVAEVLDTIESL